MNEDPIEIKILNEEPAAMPETRSKKRELGERVAKTAVSTGQKVWQSEARKKVTSGVGKGVTAVAAKGSQIVQERVVKVAEEQAKAQLEVTKERIRQTDWKAEAQKGAAASLRWLSRSLSHLAERVREKVSQDPAEQDDAPNSL